MALPNGDRLVSYTCARCGAPAIQMPSLRRCSGCQLVAYCSVACQTQDWKDHKPVCKEFPVVNGMNVLHYTTGSWEEHIAKLRKQFARLPGKKYDIQHNVFRDPKVCYTCRAESRPSKLTMCKCGVIFYCSKKCREADKWHTKACKALKEFTEQLSDEHMRSSYPLSVWYAIEELYKDYQIGTYYSKRDIRILKVHVVTNTAYFDARAWGIFFHQDTLPNIRELKLTFIIQDPEGKVNPSFNLEEKLTKRNCSVCKSNNFDEDKFKGKKHIIRYTVQQKPYHMFFSSPEYTEPDVVIVYGITGLSSDIHSELSYRNMLYSKDSVLILTDSTEDLVVKGRQAVNDASPVDELVPPILNRLRWFGSNKYDLEFEAAATNIKYYLTCVRKKSGQKMVDDITNEIADLLVGNKRTLSVSTLIA